MKLETERLILRDWCAGDREAFARILGDPEARPFHPNVYSRQQADDLLDAIMSRGNPADSMRAAALKHNRRLVGIVGLSPIGDALRSAMRGRPQTEIGWQFDKSVWGQGLAPEAAQAWLQFAWQQLSLKEVVAFTFTGNLPSQRVMQKIGMTRDPLGDFMHPNLPDDHPLRPHVLYRINNPLL